METKSCRACATAKRRCGKQTPHCLRCATRGIKCVYPPTKPNSFVLCKEDPLSDASQAAPTKIPQLLGGGRSSRPLQIDEASNPLSLLPGPDVTSWFASLEKWQVRFPTPEQGPLSVPDLNRFIETMFRWLKEWVDKGSNPFIHVRLYQTRFPRCVQDAYGALSCYFRKTTSNEEIAFRIIEDRARDLVAEHAAPPTGSLDLDPLQRVARVHAMLVYQIIGLFDGQIRLRHLAETYMPVLNSWMQEIVIYASQDASLGRYLISPASVNEKTSEIHTSQDENMLWYSWILTESIRRAWVLGSGVQVVFMALQQHKIDSCSGGMMITTRQGIWEAESSVAWEKLCLKYHVGQMQVDEIERLFIDFAPSEVNEFTKVALEVVFGREKMERWAFQNEGR